VKEESFDFCKESSSNPNQLIVNLSSIKENVQRLKGHFQRPMRIMAILKANAYGTNYAVLSRYLRGVGIDIVGAANLVEALFFKTIGVEQEIFLLHAFEEEAEQIVENGFVVSVDDPALIEALQSQAKKQRRHIKVHLKIETGMGRFGISPKDALSLAFLIQGCDHLDLEGVSTHFSCADVGGKERFTIAQYESFCEVLRCLQREGMDPNWRHVANSSGSIRFDFPECNMVRIGLALYGIPPCSVEENILLLEPSLALQTRVVKVSLYEKGHPIGYGCSYHVQKEVEKIAVLPIGYFDGIHQQYRRASFLICGKRAPIVGKICMDYIMCDVTHIPNVKTGDRALLFGKDDWGNEVSPQEWADLAGCDVRQFICCLGPRIKRLLK
jgi:Alr-MurF fusion protein